MKIIKKHIDRIPTIWVRRIMFVVNTVICIVILIGILAGV
jgi:hypothetical protein